MSGGPYAGFQHIQLLFQLQIFSTEEESDGQPWNCYWIEIACSCIKQVAGFHKEPSLEQPKLISSQHTTSYFYSIY